MAEFARHSLLTLLRHGKKLLPNKRVRLFALIITLSALAVSLAFVDVSFAQFEGLVDVLVRTVTWIMMQIAIVFIQITIFFLRYFILIAGYNDFINANIVELGWNMVRDVTNMFFIVILMVIAFGTILGLDQYEWRKTLVKLLMAALLVNFSNTIIQLMIDVVHIFTTTFLNAVAGAAAGNLINMFNYDKLFSIVGKNPDFFGGNDLILEFFAAGLMSLVFAATSMITMGAYVVIMLGRVVTLWMAIIISPLMFLFSVLPQTKKYADEYWGQVTNSLLAAPVMVFFLWLAFATFGGGQSTVDHFSEKQAESRRIGQENVEALGEEAAVGLSRAATWNNMANFAVAIAFLWLGLDQVRKLGVPGSGLTQKAQKFAANVATIASGYAAGRFLYEKGFDVAKGATVGGIKLAAAPVTGRIRDRIAAEKAAAKAQLMSYGRREDSEFGGGVKGATERFLARRVRGYIQRQKRTKKMQGAAEFEEKMAYTRNEADVSMLQAYQFEERDRNGHAIMGIDEGNVITREGNVWTNASGQQIAGYDKDGKLLTRTEIAEANGANVVTEIDFDKLAALPRDRYLEGVMQGEQERKAAKDKQFQGLGRQEVLRGGRVKDGKRDDRKTMAEEIGSRLDAAAIYADEARIALEDAQDPVVALERKRNTERRLVRSEAEAFRKSGQKERAESMMAALEDKFAKEDAELYGRSGSYVPRMKWEQDISNEIAAIERDLAGNITDDVRKDLIKRRSGLIRKKTNLSTISNVQSLEDSRDARERALLGSEEWQKQDPKHSVLNADNALRAELTRHVGFVGNTDEEVEAGIKKFRDAYDSYEEYQAALRLKLNSQKKAGIDGDDNAIGVLQEFKDKNGNIVITWGGGIHFNEKGEREEVYNIKTGEAVEPVFKADRSAETMAYYQTRRKLSSIDQPDSMMNVGWIDIKQDDGTVKREKRIVNVEDQQIKSLQEIFRGADSRRLTEHVQASFWDGINSIDVKSLSEAARGQFEKMLEEVASVLKDQRAQNDWYKLVDGLVTKLSEVDETN